MKNDNNQEKYNIICFSNQQWDYPLPTNKKHVMSRLAARGHNVLFVDPPINTGRLFIRQIFRGQWRLSRLLTRTYKSPDCANVTVFSPLKPLPNAKLTSDWHISKINRLSNKVFDSSRKTLLWIYHVEIEELENFLDNLEYDKLVYDCVDNYAAFPENSTFYSATVPKEKIISQEKMLTQRADVVFATAPGLVDKLKKYRDVVHFTPNVGNFPKFSVAQNLKKEGKVAPDLETIKRPRIGFTGAVDEYKFDTNLVKKVAADFPNFNFVIIGPLALKDIEASKEALGFEDFDNIYFLGSRPYEILETYYAGFDAYMIPYQLNDYTVGGCFPVKYHEALAAGIPTIVTDLPAYYPFKDVSYIAKSYEEFSEMLGKALTEDSPEKIKERIQVASKNDWESKVTNLLFIIGTLISK